MCAIWKNRKNFVCKQKNNYICNMYSRLCLRIKTKFVIIV
nr:MAG TPA: hypothetical protein [Caudoviricetes sp.]